MRLLSPEALEAKQAAHWRHLEIVAQALRRRSMDDLRRLLPYYERMRLVDEARLVRAEWARRAPQLGQVLAHEAVEYERRRMIDAQDAMDPMGCHAALKHDLDSRDLAGVEHELMMYERLGWDSTARACRMELERRREVAQKEDGNQ